MPNRTQTPTTNYNYEMPPPQVENLTQQPAIRIDYQLSSKLRLNGKYSGQRARAITTPGLIPGFSDVFTPYPYITNYAFTVNYTLSPTTFVEATYGFIRNELAGGNENGVLVNESSNRLNELAAFPLIYPNAGKVDIEGYYANEVLDDVAPPWWDGQNRMMNLPPIFNWGGRIGAAPPNQRYPGWLNINRTQDVAASITKVMGRHTLKAGFYNNHSFKAQNVGAGGGLSFQGTVDFGNSTDNGIDTGFGYSNAYTGVFTRYQQASDFVEGQMVYDNTEFYIQDNWKLNSRTTLDYGVRFTHQGPQYDKNQAMSNFFPELWDPSQAQTLYIPGCSNGATICSGNTLNAMDPRNNRVLIVPGTANTQAAIGTPIPDSGNPLNGIRQAGDGIAKTGYTWPAIVVGPRFGVAYDISGNQMTVLRARRRRVLRPSGRQHRLLDSRQSADRGLRGPSLRHAGDPDAGPQHPAEPAAGDVPVRSEGAGTVAMERGRAARAAVGHGHRPVVRRQPRLQPHGRAPGWLDRQPELDRPRCGLPAGESGSTRAASTVPGAKALPANLLRSLSGPRQHQPEHHGVLGHLPLTPGLAEPPVPQRILVRSELHLRDFVQGQHRPADPLRPQLRRHVPTARRSGPVREAQRDARPPSAHNEGKCGVGSAEGCVDRQGRRRNPQRLAAGGRTHRGLRSAYDLNYNYKHNGSNQNLTGSPDFGARIVYVGDPGSGCSSNQYNQFNVNSVTGPTYNSAEMESGRNILRGCADHRVDMWLSRDIRMGGNRRFEFRLDVFNLFDTVISTGSNNTINYVSPTDLTIRNSQTLADGSNDPARLVPRNAGFGAATNAMALRSMQLQFGSRFNLVWGASPPGPPYTVPRGGPLAPLRKRWLARFARSRGDNSNRELVFTGSRFFALSQGDLLGP